MGLIKAAINAVSGTLADQYKEYIYCDALASDILAAKGRKRVGSKGTNAGADNLITNGSAIAVNEGQCALIVADGKVVEVAAEAGVFEYKSDMTPSVFAGDLGDAIINTLKDIGGRLTYGGEAGRDQRVYYINTKEILDNKYGTVNPIPFRVLDKNIGLDVDVTLRCNGEYTYRITNPVLFYTNVCGNVPDVYRRSTLDSTLKSEVVTALQPALAKISELGVRPSGLPGHTLEICDALNEILSKKWGELRGLHIESFNMNPPTLSKEDQAMITDLQRKAVYRNADMGMAHLVEAQGDAMKIAAGNQGGAMMGFMGMNMAQQAGGFNAQNMMAMQQQQAVAQQQMAAAAPAPAPQAAPAANTWKCSCGTENTGKFCADCGTPKPADSNFWSCACGAQNKGKFCCECGKPKPAGAPLYKCDKCGWEPEDPKNPPKFCPECGDPFDADDIV